MILYSTLESVNSELTTFEEVVYQKESKLFKEAMKEEMDSLIKNKTMILSNRPKDLKMIVSVSIKLKKLSLMLKVRVT